jgi:glycosyltransferase involved in cell wall biosynthesis
MTRSLRVLFLEPSALVTGGAIALLRLIGGLDTEKFKPLVVLGSDGPLVDDFRRIPGCRVLRRPFPPSLSRVSRFSVITGGLANPASAIAYGLWLRRVADRWGADIIHSNGLKMHLLSTLAMRPGRRVLIWHIRDFISAPYMPRRTASLLRCLVRLVPNVIICNSVSTLASLENPPRAVVVEGGVLSDFGLTRYHTVPDGVVLGLRATSDRDDDETRSKKRVLMLGRIAEWKGQHVFVRAARRLCESDRSTEFIIAGGATTEADAEYERQLRASVEALGLSGRILFAGVVQDVPALLSTADVVVHCSTSPEPFGQVVIEAMAASIAVVASNLGGPTEIIRDGVNGRLFPPSDDVALAGTLRELLDNASLRRQLAIAGHQTAEDRFGIDRTAARICQLYREYAVSGELKQASPSA